MTNKEILQADMLDILFEHRNKLYGAYALRRNYNHRMGIALAISLSAVLFLLASSFIKKNNGGSSYSLQRKDSVILRTYEVTKPTEEKKKIKVNVQQVQSTNRIVLTKDESTVQEQEKIAVSNVGTENKTGDIPDDPNKNIVVESEVKGNGNSNQKEPETIVIDERAPEFPGGQAAWISFLKKFLQSPEELESGQRVSVLIRFWVDIDGSISRLEVIKSGGNSFDKEVLRVMKKMPRWEPASQNGHKIAVAFTQPVSFVGVEE